MPYTKEYWRSTSPSKERSYHTQRSQKCSNYWSSLENNANNAWNVNFSSGNVNNNNKYNTNNVARAVAEHSLYGNASIKTFGEFYRTVVEAFFDCLRGKRGSKEASEYMLIADEDLPILAYELWTGTYSPSISTCFLVKYPKLREVFAANFRDRIVHHWIILRLEPLLEARFIRQGNVSYNCRKGFGTLRCIKDLEAGLRKVTCDYKRKAWIFKFDIQGFFMSIPKSLLRDLLLRFIDEKYDGPDILILKDVVAKTVMHHPEMNCVVNTSVREWVNLEFSRSLFGADPDNGEPIGNLTTQHFANFFMSFFDQFVIELFKGKNYAYFRFVDDAVIICDDKEFLLESIKYLEFFLYEKLRLRMHPKKRYFQPASHGVEFVGAWIKPHRTYISNRTVSRFMEKMYGFNIFILKKRTLNIMDISRIRSVVNSYLGFMICHSAYKIRRKILESMDQRFMEYFNVVNFSKITVKQEII